MIGSLVNLRLSSISISQRQTKELIHTHIIKYCLWLVCHGSNWYYLSIIFAVMRQMPHNVTKCAKLSLSKLPRACKISKETRLSADIQYTEQFQLLFNNRLLWQLKYTCAKLFNYIFTIFPYYPSSILAWNKLHVNQTTHFIGTMIVFLQADEILISVCLLKCLPWWKKLHIGKCMHTRKATTARRSRKNYIFTDIECVCVCACVLQLGPVVSWTNSP